MGILYTVLLLLSYNVGILSYEFCLMNFVLPLLKYVLTLSIVYIINSFSQTKGTKSTSGSAVAQW